MKSARDKYDLLKIQLGRLNEDWSLTGETFSHQAALHIRQAVWDDKNLLASLRQLMLAICSLQRQYARHVDPDTMPACGPGDAHTLDRWNQTFTATAYIMDELESFLSQKERDQLGFETIAAYKQSYQN